MSAPWWYPLVLLAVLAACVAVVRHLDARERARLAEGRRIVARARLDGRVAG